MNAPDTARVLGAAPGTDLPATGQSRAHESARAQVAGTATYIDDLPELRGTLHAAPILSPVAHGRLRGVDATAALAAPGVRGVVLAGDIPGDPLLATYAHDEPIFACETVQHVGQVIGLVLADTAMQARRAARLALAAANSMNPKAVLAPAVGNQYSPAAMAPFVQALVELRKGQLTAARLEGSN